VADALSRPGLASRTALAMAAVALLAVLITGAVALPLIPRAAERQARESLAAQAELVAATYEERSDGVGATGRLVRLGRLLQAEDITLSVVGPRGRTTGGPNPDDVRSVLAGESVSTVRETPTGSVFVEARPAVDGGGVILTQPAEVVRDPARGAVRTLLRAMLIGLGVAVVAGVVLARWIAGPLRRAALGARELAAGRRDVVVEPSGPREVAEVADALNALTTALTTSEHRQRDFLLSVSHELRTPLTTVRGYAEALADGVVPPSEAAQTGVTIGAEAVRLERLVGDLLDLARLGADDFRLDVAQVDLAALVTDAAQVWSRRALTTDDGGGPVVRVEVPPGSALVVTDPVRVRQILDGLTDNAVRVTPTGRPVVLALRVLSEHVVLEVRDGGPGLTDDDLAVAFDRSALHERYRGRRRVGTGVGLALVAGLAQRLGGSAYADHAREGGATFGVRLPRDPTALQNPNTRPIHA